MSSKRRQSFTVAVKPQPTASDILVDAAVALFLADRKNANLSEESIKLYVSKLGRWLEWRRANNYPPGLSEVNIEELRAHITYLQEERVPMDNHPKAAPRTGERLAPATVQAHWRTLRNAWNFFAREGLLQPEQHTYFAAKRVPCPKVAQHIRPTYTVDVLQTLITAAQSVRHPSDSVSQREERAARDVAILRVIYDTGVRGGEVGTMMDVTVDAAERQGQVMGKGNVARWVFWTKETQRAIDAYRAVRRGPAFGPLFRGVGRTNNGGAMTSDSIRQLVRRLGKRAEAALPKSAPVHAWRHTFAHRFLDNGGDGLYLQQLLGHASITTTQRYVRENAKRLRKIYRKHLDNGTNENNENKEGNENT